MFEGTEIDTEMNTHWKMLFVFRCEHQTGVIDLRSSEEHIFFSHKGASLLQLELNIDWS